MKKYVIELDDTLSDIYEGIAKMSHKSTEETMRLILKSVIERLAKENPQDWQEYPNVTVQ